MRSGGFGLYIVAVLSMHYHSSLYFHLFSPSVIMNVHWTTPAPGEVKVNVHGATLQAPAANGKNTGLGTVIRR